MPMRCRRLWRKRQPRLAAKRSQLPVEAEDKVVGDKEEDREPAAGDRANRVVEVARILGGDKELAGKVPEDNLLEDNLLEDKVRGAGNSRVRRNKLAAVAERVVAGQVAVGRVLAQRVVLGRPARRGRAALALKRRARRHPPHPRCN